MIKKLLLAFILALLSASPALGAVALYGAQQCIGSAISNQNTFSISNANFDSSGGTNTMIIIFVEFMNTGTGATISSVTYNGDAATFAGSSGYSYIYYRVAPDTGGNLNVTANFTSNFDRVVLSACMLENVDQGSPVDAPATSNGTPGPAELTFSSAAGDMTFAGLAWHQDSQSLTLTSGTTIHFDTASDAISGYSARQAGAGSVTFSWTLGDAGHDWYVVGVNVNQAAAAPTAPLHNRRRGQ